MKPVLSQNEIVEIYHSIDAAGKIAFQRVFGKEPFQIDLFEKIKTFEDGLAFKGLKAEDVLPIVPSFMKPAEKCIHGLCKLIFLIEIFNEGWVADFSKDDIKYWPWMIYKAGSGLSLRDVDSGYSRTCVASRLCIKGENTCRKFANQFQSIYNEHML